MNPEVRARLSGWYARWDAWEGGDRVLRGSPVQALFRRRAAGRLAVLGYHGIEDPAVFAEHLDLIGHAFAPVSLDQVEQAVRGGRQLPAYSVLITFDDGDRSVHMHALPLLAERALPAVCFVVPGLIGTDTPFWWDEVEHLARHGGVTRLVPPAPPGILVHTVKLLPEPDRRRALEELRATATEPAPRRRQLTAAELRELEAGGIAIGNHTLTHPCLDRCDTGRVRTEILDAHELLTDMLGRVPTSFAYPNGNEDERAHQVLAEAGYRSAFLYNHRLAAPRSCHPLRIDRLVVSGNTSAERLETILSGLHPAVFRSLRAAARTAAPAAQLISRRF